MFLEIYDDRSFEYFSGPIKDGNDDENGSSIHEQTSGKKSVPMRIKE